MSTPILFPNQGPLFSQPPPDATGFLGLSQTQLDTLTASSATGFQSDNPFSILLYSKTVAAASREAQQQDREFELSDAIAYRDVHVESAVTAGLLSLLIRRRLAFRDEYNKLSNDLHSFANTLNNKNDAILNQYDNAGPDGYYNEWGRAADAAYFLLNATTFTQGETDALYNDYVNKVNIYNDTTNSINAKIQDYNNFLADQGDFITDINTINALRVELGLDDIEGFTSISLDPIPLYPLIGIPPPPPWPPNLFFDNPVPRGHTYPESNNHPNELHYPPVPGPERPYDANVTVPPPLNEGDFKNVYINPLEELIKHLKDLEDKIRKINSFQAYFRLAFGQRVLGEVPLPAVGAQPGFGGSGSSGVLSALADKQLKNVHFDESFGKSQLETVYALNGVPAGSPLIANIDGFAEDLLAGIIAKSVEGATTLATGALVGASPGETPAIQAAAALALLENVQGLVATNAIYNTVLEGLLSDPANAGKSQEELATLARGIASALNLEFLKFATLQVETAIGLSGLLPQILANLGSVSSDKIVQFVNGLVNYKNLFDNPHDRALVEKAFIAAFTEALGRQEAELAVKEALAKLEAQGPFKSEEAAKEALRRTLEEDLRSRDIAAADAKRLVAQGFASLEAPVLPVDESIPYVDLSPQQQLGVDLKAAAFNNDLRSELLNSNLDRDEAERVANQVDVATRDSKTVDDRKTIALGILNREGVEEAEALVAQVAKGVEAPLRSFTVTPPVPPPPVLSAEFEENVTRLLANQGVAEATAAEQAAHFAALIFTAPDSISHLTDLNLTDYAKSVGKSQSDAATETFKDSIRPTLSLLAFQQERMSLANDLVYANNPFYGDTSPRVGPAGGAPVNPIIV